jgi:hypothetical protein
MSVARIRLRRFARSAGLVVLGFVALDFLATVATLAMGARWLGR